MATAAPVGAGNRLSAAGAEAKKRAAGRLQPALEKANTQTYLRAMQAHARAFGAVKPKEITDKAVLSDIATRARVSADSIVNTQADRMRALVANLGSISAAQAPFKQWEASQRALIGSYEAGMAINAASSDFQANNPGLTGTERCEPQDAVCDACNEAIDMGDVPIGTLPDMPLHMNCMHGVIVQYDMPDDPSSLWYGQEAP